MRAHRRPVAPKPEGMTDYHTRKWRYWSGVPYRYSMMLQKERVMSVIRRISRRRVVWKKEAIEIAYRIANKISGFPDKTVEAALPGMYHYDFYFVNGKFCLLPADKWAEHEAAARSNGWQFCSMSSRRQYIQRGIWNKEDEAYSVKHAINELRKAIRDERKDHKHRAA